MITPLNIKYKRTCREYLDKVCPEWEVNFLDGNHEYSANINGHCIVQTSLEDLAREVAKARKERIPQ